MAEDVISSAASSVISSTINSLGTLAWAEIKFLKDVPEKVRLIETKLKLIQSYLKDVENKPQQGNLTKCWLSELKAVTYRAQDVIEKIHWLQQRRNRARGFTGIFSRYFHIPGYLKSLHQIGEEIDRINNFIPGISDMMNNLNSVNLGESSSMADQFEDQQLHDPREAIYYNEEDEIIGFESEITEIINDLLDPGNKPLSVISLVGMGGIGKTTLAKKVSNHSEVKNHFDTIVSVIVSKEYSVLNIHKEMLKSVTQITNEDLEKMDEGKVQDKLSDALEQQKYLILIDDIWETKSWDEINPGNKIFPDIDNGSRILLSTRNIEVANYPDFRNLIHNIKFLDDEKSLKLLKNKAFPSYLVVSDQLRKELENQCPKLIKKCNGLPLALVVLGGYLSKHLDPHTWSRMAENVDWNEVGNKIDITKILALSYHDLPTHLKTTFLYITAFPEDHIIECSELINLWIAEGFVSPNQKYNLERTAQTYVNQLYQRGLVQIVGRSRVDGWINRIRIHDVLHDWGIERAREEGFFHVIKNFDHVKSCDPYAPYCVALHGYWYQNIAASIPNLRTIIGFELPEIWSGLHGLQSVRVIHLTKKTRTNTSLKGIKHMIFLRHIFLRNCRNIYFPSSIGELCNLQTLECHDSRIKFLPGSFWEITTLKHVHLDYIVCTWTGPKKGAGKNLHTLVIEDINSLSTVDKLQKLVTGVCRGIDAVALAIEEMEQIVQLRLCKRGALPRNLLSKISGHSHLEVLELISPINGLTRLPAASVFPPNILKLTLDCGVLVEDPMPVLQELSRLVELKLSWGYGLKRMHCSVSGFSCLKYLTLHWFRDLEDWKVPVGAMPSLCHLKLEFCPRLQEFPEGLMEHAQLQLVELELSYGLSEIDYSRLEEKGCKVIIRK